MSRTMLIDGAHPEEVRVVVMDDGQLEEFEFESAHKESSRGNIYVGEITRVEPSLQAAFISYGANRNGFLAFSEVHPEYYNLPEDEKTKLLEEFNNQGAGAQDDVNEAVDSKDSKKAAEPSAKEATTDETTSAPKKARPQRRSKKVEATESKDISQDDLKSAREIATADASVGGEELTDEEVEENARALAVANAMAVKSVPDSSRAPAQKPRRGRPPKQVKKDVVAPAIPTATKEVAETTTTTEPKTTPAKEAAEAAPKRMTSVHRRFKIDEVLKTGQKVLIQIVKEERGTKGAALTTYISMPGRFTVLMPNTPYAGGISRKITDGNERREIKKITSELNIPKGMGLIVRTAGVSQEGDSIIRDVEHLKDRWKVLSKNWEKENVSTLLHEDGSLMVRALRDMFTDDVDEVIVSGKQTLTQAKDYIKSLMPEHIKKIKEYKNKEPIFAHYGAEMDLLLLDRTRVNLPSGGYLIINPTEALVSIDVNSGRATQEKNIESTAIATNIEAAHEIARQLRLRDLAGLVVIDFIDMEDRRNDRKVERTMREAVRRDRARTQVGGISDFGLLEMSRQRLHPSLGESNYLTCSNCQGRGLIRSPASAATIIFRGLEDEDVRGKADRIVITANTQVAVYMLNFKRDMISELEKTYKMRIVINADDKYIAPDHRLDLIRVSVDGTEKSQTIERTFREELEDTKKRKRRKTRGRSNDRKDEKKEAKPQQQDNKAATNAEKSPEDRDKRRGRKPSRRGPRPPRDDAQQNNTAAKEATNKPTGNTKDTTPSANKPVAASKTPVKPEKPAMATEQKAKPEAPAPVTKPLLVETITASDNTVAAKEKASKKKSVLQRWWSKS